MPHPIVFTACVTPLCPDGTVDYLSFERLLRTQEASGNGVMLLGSTGESLAFASEEKRHIVAFACGLGLSIPILVGISGHHFGESCDWVDGCNDWPIHGYLVSTPIYARPGIVGQTRWLEALLERSSHPMMLYNNPGRTGTVLQPQVLRNLAGHPKLWAIKNTGDSLDLTRAYRHAHGGIVVYCGDDGAMPAMALEGAVGLVSMASNAWPMAIRRYVESALGAVDAVPDHARWQPVFDALGSASNPIPIKALLKEIGVIDYDTLRPPLSMDDLPSRQALVTAHEWVHSHEGASILT